MSTAIYALALVICSVGVLLLVECVIIEYLCERIRQRRPWQERLCDAVERWAKRCAEGRREER